MLSGFLDNIAAALIGGTLAASVFRQKVHIGYLAALTAVSNYARARGLMLKLARATSTRAAG